MANVRELVLKGLYRMETEEAYLNHILQEILRDKGLLPIDRAFATELLTGVIRHRLRLDYIIEKFSKIKLKKLSPWVHQILRMGVYQLIFMDRIPQSAACNESVKLARRYAHGAAQGYVNGLLRSVAREKESIEYPTEPLARLSVFYSCPLWLTEKLFVQYGAETCEKILASSHQKQPTFLRVNRLKTTTQDLKKNLEKEGVFAKEDARESWRLFTESALDVYRSKSYLDGLYSIQNLSSQEAVRILAPKSGEFVLDLCAAPGGKTTAMAEIMENKGRILAFDIHPHKTELIMKSAERLGISIIETRAADAAVYLAELSGVADRVLADVPCSGIGVIHKKPDIKWRRSLGDITALCEIQRGILETAARYLKKGGTLVYSTCTILQEENQEQVAAFLQRHPEFALESEQVLLTHETGGSGFYIAKLVRKG